MSAYREAYTSKLTNFWPNSSIQQYNLTNSIQGIGIAATNQKRTEIT